ncbi:MAG: HU family DNA-binding protein, partial [Deltaproteobacteria bacterium]|nr:HU family DNA-binding protein [Deltaproteobacteria bacterium]
MTKAELVDAIAKLSKFTKADSEKALGATINAIINALKTYSGLYF